MNLIWKRASRCVNWTSLLELVSQPRDQTAFRRWQDCRGTSCRPCWINIRLEVFDVYTRIYNRTVREVITFKSFEKYNSSVK